MAKNVKEILLIKNIDSTIIKGDYYNDGDIISFIKNSDEPAVAINKGTVVMSETEFSQATVRCLNYNYINGTFDTFWYAIPKDVEKEINVVLSSVNSIFTVVEYYKNRIEKQDNYISDLQRKRTTLAWDLTHLQDRVQKASWWQRLKYLFGGELND